ncbi:MAG: hypothetical protein BWY67_02058 [Bacteroidetes bacterium ADurb.Bin397]|nr:MAG: hypothetical protein BWY67_02058 [Bacteroidetes bacterium ADurb.Bin397]
MKPSLNSSEKGAVPVKATESSAFSPAQMEVVPVIVAVGSGLIVIVAVPEPVFEQFKSLTSVMLYSVVCSGLASLI